ncbi:hypothetical protein SKAU_G00221710 [Synaphobranchus kaupii]|uniref:Uncharacterized protein n=1 Tax=Synaphobranchus kaupii TaxID=118154 RepID=A0A9Q1IVK1_SYNKA|nr:hypothetical protein SKAU_G00221710 [Synaphobranchus kaupii]
MHNLHTLRSADRVPWPGQGLQLSHAALLPGPSQAPGYVGGGDGRLIRNGAGASGGACLRDRGWTERRTRGGGPRAASGAPVSGRVGGAADLLESSVTLPRAGQLQPALTRPSACGGPPRRTLRQGLVHTHTLIHFGETLNG